MAREHFDGILDSAVVDSVHGGCGDAPFPGDGAADERLDPGDDGLDASADRAEPGTLDAPGAAPGDASLEVPATSRKVHRRGRRTRMRSKTIALKRLTREELRLGALLYPTPEVARPCTRGECAGEERPCPWVSCKYHLYLDVNPETGSIKINFPDVEVWEMRDTCALDVAERSGITLEEVGEIMNLTRERVRQVEVRGLLKLKVFRPDGD